jgi:hypothetical protein
MRLTLIVIAFATLAMPTLTAADEVSPVNLVCSPRPPLVCASFSTTAPGRFDPLMQQLMVRQQLDGQAKGWGVIFLYVPNADVRTLEELQIRFLDELLARERAAKSAQKPATEGDKP